MEISKERKIEDFAYYCSNSFIKFFSYENEPSLKVLFIFEY